MLYSVIKLTMELVKCPSISPKDAGCQDIIIKYLKNMGFAIEQMNFGNTRNLWAWRGEGKTLVFAGHTDVVPTGDINRWITHPFHPIIHNGMLFGRGTADMKGSLAAMIIATERFIKHNYNYKGRLAFLITSDEESDGTNGTVKVVESLIARNEHFDYCLIGEPSSIKNVGDAIKNGRRGSLTCNLTIHGVQGHIAYPHLSENPVHRAIPMLKELITTEWDQGNAFFPPTSMQIFSIKTGTNSSNIIPGDLFIQFNFRFSTELTDESIKTQVINLLERYKLQYTIEWWLLSQPFITKHGKLLNITINSIEHYNNIKPQVLTTGGSSDGKFIIRMGAQVVELGLVNSTIHKINECIKVNDLTLLTRMYQLIIEKIFF